MNARHRIADIAEALEPGNTLPAEDREWLRDAIKKILSGQPADAALGVAIAPGQRSLQYVERHRRRDALLRETAARFWPGPKMTSEQARQLNVGLSRYRETAWRYERALDECPARLLGTQQEMYWLILKQVDAALAAGTIREILRAS